MLKPSGEVALDAPLFEALEVEPVVGGAPRSLVEAGLPTGTGSITRIELTGPVGGPDRGRSPVLRTYWSLSPTSR